MINVRRRLMLLPLILCTGCVERSYRILSDPPGALVYRDGKPIGAAPAGENFTYYGKRTYTLVKEGYEPLVVVQDIPRPYYQFPGLDFVFEHLVPFTFHDHHELAYVLQPKIQTRTDELEDRANQRRTIGKGIGDAGTPLQPPELPSPTEELLPGP